MIESILLHSWSSNMMQIHIHPLVVSNLWRTHQYRPLCCALHTVQWCILTCFITSPAVSLERKYCLQIKNCNISLTNVTTYALILEYNVLACSNNSRKIFMKYIFYQNDAQYALLYSMHIRFRCTLSWPILRCFKELVGRNCVRETPSTLPVRKCNNRRVYIRKITFHQWVKI